MAKTFSLSGAIDACPERFTLEELATNAEELLRAQGCSTGRGAIQIKQVQFYIDRRLVDAPVADGNESVFGRRHLLQLTVVQVLRGLNLQLDEIGELVREVDDKNLKLLLDEPAEAEKKANVMRNWLGVIARGRYRGSDRDRPDDQLMAASGTTVPPPLRPSRVPLVTANRKISRAKRTLMGNSGLDPDSELHLPGGLPMPTPFGSDPGSSMPSARRRTLSRPTTGSGLPKLYKKLRASDANKAQSTSTWTRHEVSPGVELHVSSGEDFEQIQNSELTALLVKIRRILQGK